MTTNRLTLSTASLILGLTLSAATLHSAPPDDKGKPDSAGKGKSGDVHVDVGLSATISAGISVGDARVLATEYGMTGGKPLPPGIRKNMARGKPMPPGIQKTRMPQAFVERLPRHDGYEWRQAGTDLVLVASGTLIISDILEGVFD